MGHTLIESLEYDNGQPLNANLVDYRVPRFTDLPDHFETALIEIGDGPGPYGAKGRVSRASFRLHRPSAMLYLTPRACAFARCR